MGRKELLRGGQGKDKVWLHQATQMKAAFMDKRASILQEPQELTSHPVGFDDPSPTHCMLLIINHFPGPGPQLINQLKNPHKATVV